MPRDRLAIWTVYDHPPDYPEHFVARKFNVSAAGAVPCGTLVISTNLEDLQDELVAHGLSRLERSPQDDPKVLESWT